MAKSRTIYSQNANALRKLKYVQCCMWHQKCWKSFTDCKVHKRMLIMLIKFMPSIKVYMKKFFTDLTLFSLTSATSFICVYLLDFHFFFIFLFPFYICSRTNWTLSGLFTNTDSPPYHILVVALIILQRLLWKGNIN